MKIKEDDWDEIQRRYESEEEDSPNNSKLAKDIEKLLENNGVEVEDDVFSKAFNEFQKILGMVEGNIKGPESSKEEQQTEEKNKEPDPWETLKHKLEGMDDDAASDQPKEVSVTMIAMGKPKKKFMRDSGEISKKPSFESASALEEDDED